MRGEVIAIGDELTSGQRLDTNSQWLSEQLGELGVEVMFHTTVGDDLEANIAVFRAAIDRADVVVCTGGLGPTADDLTRDAIADAMGVELVEDPDVLQHIQGLYERRGREMPQRNALQARFPEGTSSLHNPNGTAPGVFAEIAREGRSPCLLFALPGVPDEMREMWSSSVAPVVRDARPGTRIVRHHRIKCFGVGESNLEAMLPDMIRRGREPRVGITASKATLTLRVTATGADEAACLAAMGPTLAAIRELVGDLAFGEEDDELQHVVVRQLREAGQTLAVSDSATHGLLGRWLTEADTERQALLLSEALHRDALVSEEEVRRHAEAVRKQHRADYALVVGKPVPTGNAMDGRVWIATAGADDVRASAYINAGHPSLLDDRLAKQALDQLRRRLLRLPAVE